MSFKENIYQKCPYWIQNRLISYYGKKLINERYGDVYYSELNRLLNKDFSNLREEKITQLSALREFLKYAVQNSPYYKEKYKGIDITAIHTINDLKKLPVISKEDLRQNINRIYTLNEEDAIVSFTGGTTGKSLKVCFDKKDMQRRMAYLDAFKHRAGIENLMTARKATFSGRQLIPANAKKRFWRFNKPYNQRLYSTFHINEKNLTYYINDLQKFKPDLINGFVSSIYEVAQYVDKHKISLSFIPRAIFTTSESLLPFHRVLIERVFKAKIFNQYASAEGAPFITECREGNLHYNLDTGVIEQGKLDEDGAGDMMVTSFTTHGTPLIRYGIKDRIIFKKGECSCGMSHPLVKSIEGRQVDYLTATDGTKVSLSHLADVIKGIPNSIKKIQFIQRVENELEVSLVIDKDLYEERDKSKLISSLQYRFGKTIDITITVLDDIPRERSGKYALIKNYLN